MRPRPETPRAGQESVWSYPRPPRLEETPKELRVVFAGEEVARTTRALRVLETSHPPTYYIPLEDVREGLLAPAAGQSFCEWKGAASYYDLVLGDHRAERAAWTYPDPTPRFQALRGHVAFFLPRVDAAYVDGEAARPQPGGFYGGWITSDLAGPFKGGPGTHGW
jgi:uncharacterized protein (DUF427 family)